MVQCSLDEWNRCVKATYPLPHRCVNLFQKSLSWRKRSTPIVSGSSLIPWSFRVWFYLYVISFEGEHILRSSRSHSPTPQLAFFQLAGSIASAVVVKEALLFSRLLGPRFYITSSVRNLFYIMLKKVPTAFSYVGLEWW